jgi:hypothetical protein
MSYNSFKRFFSGVHAFVDGDDALTNLLNVRKILLMHRHRLHMH